MKPAFEYSRRRFLAGTSFAAVGALGFPTIVPSVVFGAEGQVAPSNKITMGCIGVGGQGTDNMNSFLGPSGCRVVAVCDVSESRRQKAKERVDARYKDQGCAMISDWRELIARKDIDAVMIATQDHWHSLIAVAAAKSGKDMYCEKPMGVSLQDGQAIRDAVRTHKRVFQGGTMQRSWPDFRHTCQLARNGYFGKIHTVEVATDGTKNTARYKGPRDPQPAPTVPPGFDWEMWQGPAQRYPYHPARTSSDWFMIHDYSRGWIVNWGVHHLDIALWGCPQLGTEPFEIEGRVTWRKEGFTDTANEWNATYTYPDGFKLVFTDQMKMPTGIRFIGDKGWVRVDRGWPGHPGLVADPVSLLEVKIRPEELHLSNSGNHHDNFLECVRSRKDPVSDVDATHKASYLGMVAEAAGRLEQKLKWDPQAERFIGNDEANALLTRPMQNGWTL